ncbi:hypothetical protein BBP40_003116 [Aspergillus hancockii]|nr:hypothetical protein BBP40_003116 [Aspergillus hancockii]
MFSILYKQLANIVDTLYEHNLDCGPPLTIGEIIAHTSSIEGNLSAWRMSLPPSLPMISAASLPDEVKRPTSNSEFFSRKFSVILTLRYYNIRTFLHRPTLVNIIDSSLRADGHDSQVLPLVGPNSLEICTESAMQFIDIVYELAHAADWEQTFWMPVFNAGLVILEFSKGLANGYNPVVSVVQVDNIDISKGLIGYIAIGVYSSAIRDKHWSAA